MKLLIVEDERDLLRALQRYFVRKGYVVETAEDGLAADQLAEENEYDLIVLDLNLPGLDGLDVLARIRARSEEQRVLILSARGEVEDRVRGLNMGANDYLPKPFSMAELDARVRALLRCQIRQSASEVRFGAFALNTDARTIAANGTKLELAPKEYAILEYLILGRGRVISAEALIEHVWSSDVNLFTESVKVHISNIRRKLKAAGLAEGIRTVKGYGYAAAGEVREE